MISRKTLIGVMGVVCLLVAAAASAQPRWGRERTPASGACFFENADFGGRYFCVRDGQRLDSLPRGMNDRISSIRLFGNAEVSVFRDDRLRGRSTRFNTDVRNLRQVGWNDQISSIEVYPGRDRGGFRGPDRGRDQDRDRDRGGDRPQWGREALPRAGACFYEERDFRGRYFCIPRGSRYAELPRGFNDSIRSIRVFGADVQIFVDRDFRGRSADVRRDVSDLRGMWRDNVSSVRVY